MAIAIKGGEYWLSDRNPLSARKMEVFEHFNGILTLTLSDIMDGQLYEITDNYTRDFLSKNYHTATQGMLSRLDKLIRDNQEELWLNLTP